ncbi:MAG: phage minor head protein [Eubacteriales bacterium]|nr:phage minor head protein [Eubacteriales bacterium]
MNFLQAQLKGRDYTEAEIDSFIKIMLKSYEDAAKDIIKEIEKFYGKYLSLVAGKGDPADIYNIIIQSDRLNKLLEAVQKIYSAYYKQATGKIIDISSLAMSNMYYRQQYILSWFVPAGINMSFVFLDPRLVEVAVLGTTDLWKKISKTFDRYGPLKNFLPQYGSLKDLLYTNKIQNLAKVQQTITQGFIQGYSNKVMANNIQGIMNNFSYQAERIARTESARTADIGARMATLDAEAQGVDIKRQWYATRDGKTRDAHITLDGQRVKPDEPFVYAGMESMGIGQWPEIGLNANCRCAILDIVNDEEPQLMRARKNPTDPEDKENVVMEFKSYNKWAEENGLVKDKNGMMIEG